MVDHDARLAIHGGPPVRTGLWPTYEHGTGAFGEDAQRAVAEILEAGRLFRYDSRPLCETATGRLEEALAAYFDSPYALAVSSGSAALTLAMLALDLPQGFEVACPAFGFPATAGAAVLAGGKPRLFAVDRDLHFDLADLERRWSDRIRVIIVVHMRGFASPGDAVIDFTAPRDIYVIEDVVPALGATLGGRLLGTFGHVGCFSTQSDKMINTGEGGFLITRDKRVYERAVLMSGAYEGKHKKHLPGLTDPASEYTLPLLNFRMDELRAALALSQLPNLDDRVSVLRRNYDYIAEQVAGISGSRLRKPLDPGGYLGDSLVFFVEPTQAEWIAKAISAEGILARSFGSTETANVRAFWHWRFISQWNEGLRDREPEYLRGTVKALRSSVDIPLSLRLTSRDLDDVVAAIRKVMWAVGNCSVGTVPSGDQGVRPRE